MAIVRTGVFSDIKLISHDQVFHLHRAILIQSPFFRRLLLNNHGKAIESKEGYLGLKIDRNGRVIRQGIELALQHLYSLKSVCGGPVPSDPVTPSEVFTILPAACFFELETLVQTCVQRILTTLSLSTILPYTHHLEQLRSEDELLITAYGPRHEYGKLVKKCCKVLEKAFEGFLCENVNMSLHQRAPKSETNGPEILEDDENSTTKSVDLLWSNLPLRWVRLILESDLLCVENEFERYELVKRVVDLRRKEQQEATPEPKNSDGWIADETPTQQLDVSAFQNGRSSSAVAFAETSMQALSQLGSAIDPEMSLWSEADTTTTALHGVSGGLGTDGVTDGGFGLKGYVKQFFGRMVPNTQQKGECPSEEETPAKKRKRAGSESGTRTPDRSAWSRAGSLEPVDEARSNAEDLSFVDAPESVASGYSVSRSIVNPGDNWKSRRKAAQTPLRPPTGRSGTFSPRLLEHLQKARNVRDPEVVPRPPVDTSPLTDLFQTAVIYTFMTFSQLERVKRDGIVPDSVVLQSFWMQAEISSGRANSLPPSLRGHESGLKFRFAVPFEDAGGFFLGRHTSHTAQKTADRKGKASKNLAASSASAPINQNTNSTVMYSPSVVCAGFQYRVLLTQHADTDSESESDSGQDEWGIEDNNATRTKSAVTPLKLRALLQRVRVNDGSNSQGNQPPAPAIAYKVYIFDPSQNSEIAAGLARNWASATKPKTRCNWNGGGCLRRFECPKPAIRATVQRSSTLPAPLQSCSSISEVEGDPVLRRTQSSHETQSGENLLDKTSTNEKVDLLASEGEGDLWAIVVIEFN
ncbi:hypothetical protein DFS34DRAFT_109791 [Phlyctochytrium arcticum]|nr:hypothetical protein DFS34DRAFT_109791 [Phlyctochytrium arcticum]